MTTESFDYCVLGDTYAEGLFLATGLARKGLRVGVVTSKALGELPPQDSIPVHFPERIGDRRLDDLLFQVGFFRLEESGLQADQMDVQYLMPKNRVRLDGRFETWMREYSREFSQKSQRAIEIRKSLSQPNSASTSRALAQILQWPTRQGEVSRMIQLEASGGRPEIFTSPEFRSRQYQSLMTAWKNENTKVYRTSQKLQQPFNQFLLEHCRKWGVSVVDQDFSFDQKFSSFKISSNFSSKNIVINSLAAARLVSRVQSSLMKNQLSHWLYFERIDCSDELVPEPLGPHTVLDLSEGQAKHPTLLFLERNRLKDQSHLMIGTWLPFEDSSNWRNEIQLSRNQVMKILPFLPKTSFKDLPNTLDLNEMKGETVRRGELERLAFVDEDRKTLFGRVFQSLKYLFRGKKRSLPQVARRIFVSAPFLMPGHGRERVLSQCLGFVEAKERRGAGRKKAA